MSTSATSRVRYLTIWVLHLQQQVDHAHIVHSGTTMQMQKGQIVLTPYAVVEQLLGMGNVELI